MTEIKLIFNANCAITPDVISCAVNNHDIKFTEYENTLTIVADLDFGIHTITIKTLLEVRLEIQHVLIDQVDLRERIYLSYLEENGTISNPATTLFRENQKLTIPFSNPISLWSDLVLSKFGHGLLGTDLYNKYDIYFPQGADLPSTAPAAIRGFFKHDANFTAVSKFETDLKKIPIQKLNLPQIDTTLFLAAIHKLQKENILTEFLTTPHQCNVNSIDDANWQVLDWYHWDLTSYDPLTNDLAINIPKSVFPELYQLLDDLKINNASSISISCLAPGAYIYPHRDKSYDAAFSRPEYDGPCQIFIPLTKGPGNYLKIANVANIDLLESGPFAFNNSQFTHSVVNLSDSTRIALTIKVDISKNQHLCVK